jgi:hypothetical protein
MSVIHLNTEEHVSAAFQRYIERAENRELRSTTYWARATQAEREVMQEERREIRESMRQQMPPDIEDARRLFQEAVDRRQKRNQRLLEIGEDPIPTVGANQLAGLRQREVQPPRNMGVMRTALGL